MQTLTKYTHKTELIHCNLNLTHLLNLTSGGGGASVWPPSSPLLACYDTSVRLAITIINSNNNNNNNNIYNANQLFIDKLVFDKLGFSDPLFSRAPTHQCGWLYQMQQLIKHTQNWACSLQIEFTKSDFWGWGCLVWSTSLFRALRQIRALG